jgi:tripartite-type tricarboxylate transporter receptor subunit TctC
MEGSVMRKQTGYLILMFLVVSLVALPVLSESAPFYERKTIKLVVGFSPGGGYDRIGRVVARYLPKYIPGKPTVVVENMDGASSIVAANYVYNVARPDGLTIGVVNRALPFAQVTKIDGTKFDMRKFEWIGSPAVEATVLTIRNDLPFKTIDELLKSKTEIPLGCTGPADIGSQFPNLLKEFAGLNPKMVIYISRTECMLATERKEVDGGAGTYSSVRPYIERKLVRPLVRGRVAEPGIESLPVDEDLVKDSKGKAIMAMRSAPDRIGRPFVCPPGTPADRMAILREALAKAVNDPELKEEGRKLLITNEYVPAEECLKTVHYVLNQPEAVVREFAKYIKF